MLFIFGFIVAHNLHAAITKIDSLRDVAEHVSPGALVIIGGLNTLFINDNPARVPYYRNALLDFMQAHKGYTTSRSAAESDLREMHPFTLDFRPGDDNLKSSIDAIRAHGGKVVCFTRLLRTLGRGDVNGSISKCLTDAGVDLSADWKDGLAKEDEQFIKTTPFLNGIVHVGSNNIGDVLMLFLGFCGWKDLKSLVIVDDEAEKISALADIADIFELEKKCLLFDKHHVAPAGFSLPRGVTDLLPTRRGYKAETAARRARKTAAARH